MNQGYSNTEFKFIRKKLLDRYGESLGSEIFTSAEKKLFTMTMEADF
jgi:hypothetical protein